MWIKDIVNNDLSDATSLQTVVACICIFVFSVHLLLFIFSFPFYLDVLVYSREYSVTFFNHANVITGTVLCDMSIATRQPDQGPGLQGLQHQDNQTRGKVYRVCNTQITRPWTRPTGSVTPRMKTAEQDGPCHHCTTCSGLR